MVYLHIKCNYCRINKLIRISLWNVLPGSTWLEISTRKIFVHLPVLTLSLFSTHISVALFTVERGSLQLLRLLFQFVVELMDALLSLDNPVTHKYNILFKKALLCRQDIFSTLRLLSPFIRRKAYQIKIPKGQSEAMNLMTDNTMTKEKITYNDLQSLHRKLKIEEHEPKNKLEVFWKESSFYSTFWFFDIT